MFFMTIIYIKIKCFFGTCWLYRCHLKSCTYNIRTKFKLIKLYFYGLRFLYLKMNNKQLTTQIKPTTAFGMVKST